jgi:hypothetical protein
MARKKKKFQSIRIIDNQPIVLKSGETLQPTIVVQENKNKIKKLYVKFPKDVEFSRAALLHKENKSFIYIKITYKHEKEAIRFGSCELIARVPDSYKWAMITSHTSIWNAVNVVLYETENCYKQSYTLLR